jgi:hypothetical protein
MLNSSISRLGAHRTLEPANLTVTHQAHEPNRRKKPAHREASALQAERNQVQKVHELTEHNALRSRVLIAQIAQFLDERFYL